MSENEPIQYDKRTVARYVKRGTIHEKDYEKHLKSLPDVADKGEPVQAEPPESDGAPTR